MVRSASKRVFEKKRRKTLSMRADVRAQRHSATDVPCGALLTAASRADVRAQRRSATDIRAHRSPHTAHAALASCSAAPVPCPPCPVPDTEQRERFGPTPNTFPIPLRFLIDERTITMRRFIMVSSDSLSQQRARGNLLSQPPLVSADHPTPKLQITGQNAKMSSHLAESAKEMNHPSRNH